MEAIDHAVAGLLIIVGTLYPVIDARRLRSRLRSLGNSPTPDRIRIYWELIAWLWLTAAIVVLYWFYRDYSFDELGFSVRNTLGFWSIASVVGLFAGALVLMCFGLRRNADLRSRVREDLEKMDESYLLPRDRRELRYWILCSISASSEELLFRGFFLWYLLSQFNIGLAMAGSTFLFAVAHAYQGLAGIWRSGVYGAVLVAVFVISGSIWPAIVLHVAQDLYSGMAGYLSTQDHADLRLNSASIQAEKH